MNCSNISNKVTTDRLYYLDWLRIFATIVVFTYHSDIFFDLRKYSMQDTIRSLASTIHREFCQLWMMPLFFIISGAAVFYSLQFRNTREFIKEKFFRLLIPVIIIGIFVIASLQVYYFRLHYGQITGSFFQWYPHYFEGFFPFGNFSPVPMHLWYMEVLFLFCIVLLPLIIPFGKMNLSIISRVSFPFKKPWALFALFIPLAITSISADILGRGVLRLMGGGWDYFSHILFFIYGYLIFSDTRIPDMIKKHFPAFLIMALLFTGLYIYLSFFSGIADISGVARHYYLRDSANVNEVFSYEMSMTWIGVLILRSLTSWCWLLSLTGIGSRFLNFKNKLLDYCNEAVLPFYIFHLTVIYIIGYYVIQWNIGIGIKYLIITSSSFLIIMALYEILVRRIKIFRFLFGMKPKKSRKILG